MVDVQDAYRYVMQHPVMVAEWITDHLCISLIAIAIGTVLGVTTGIFIAGKGREGKLCVLLGPSGYGKITTMKMINWLIMAGMYTQTTSLFSRRMI